MNEIKFKANIKDLEAVKEDLVDVQEDLSDVQDTLALKQSASMFQQLTAADEGRAAYVHSSKWIPVKPTEELYSGTFKSDSDPITVKCYHYSMIVVLGRAGGTATNSCNVCSVIPMANLEGAANPIKYGLVDDANHFFFTVSAPDPDNDNQITITYSAGSDTTNGRITRIYGIY